ncbi:hypothetical protein H0H87_004622 [Tephrocybe sp. NHM501043]|nr:hypothetical protein H0H87_004622 [Tephrocybe sp. NHM501043]
MSPAFLRPSRRKVLPTAPQIPYDLILEVIETHLDDVPTLVACSLTSSFLVSACHKKLFSTITLVVSPAQKRRNKQFDDIVRRNPSIPTYAENLKLELHSPKPNILPASLASASFAKIRSFSLVLNTSLSLDTPALNVLGKILLCPTIVSVALQTSDIFSTFHLPLIRLCAGAQALVVDLKTPLIHPEYKKKIDYGSRTHSQISTLSIRPGCICLHVLSQLDISRLRSLNSTIHSNDDAIAIRDLLNESSALVDLHLSLHSMWFARPLWPNCKSTS